jgi:MFS family permease
VIRFKKFGVSILLPLFGVNLDIATVLLAMIPFFTILFTPLFGALVDKVGKATMWMVVGAALVLTSHLIITFAPQGVPMYAYIAIALLGIGYSLVPSAMWPSVPKIIPEKLLGSAYALIFWVQNIGLGFVPLLIGWLLNEYCISGERVVDGQTFIQYDYTLPMCVFACFGIIALLLAFALKSEDKRKGYGLEQPNIK